MSATTTTTTGGDGALDAPGGPSRRPSAAVAFLAILRRDVTVAVHEAPSTIAQMILQPVFLLFVFGRVLPELGYARDGYVDVLFPGIVALTVVLTALQGIALPLVLEFSYTMEIEDRLLAPISTSLVAVEKLLFSALRSIVATALLFPIGAVLLGGIPGEASDVPLVALVIVLGAFIGASAGLLLGTILQPAKIRTMFSLMITPLIFTGASQYPWPLLDELRWFQVLTAFNPITYTSEALRAVLSPQVPHMHLGVAVFAMVAFLLTLGAAGVAGFRRRATS